MKTGLLRTLEDLMVAVTFAEKDQKEYAIKLLKATGKRNVLSPREKKLSSQQEASPRMRL
jgi:hypothetical protein